MPHIELASRIAQRGLQAAETRVRRARGIREGQPRTLVNEQARGHIAPSIRPGVIRREIESMERNLSIYIFVAENLDMPTDKWKEFVDSCREEINREQELLNYLLT